LASTDYALVKLAMLSFLSHQQCNMETRITKYIEKINTSDVAMHNYPLLALYVCTGYRPKKMRKNKVKNSGAKEVNIDKLCPKHARAVSARSERRRFRCHMCRK